jgi:hypothetical protein
VYYAEISQEIWWWFGKSARLFLMDHGPYDSQKLAKKSADELAREQIYWFFSTAVIRKA